eukprot:TRINITY_DN1623_c2_g2_i2.p1 TRINITY_DN1623_c2_g2~~TRINITY_DN1623_c2_g2_i2.p1  ORF type:complete len:395 (+),score=56.45 TRINITY_DN1623_c2_g2_i2:605-1789(+)
MFDTLVYEELTQLRNGGFYFVETSNGGSNKHCKHQFDRLLKAHFSNYYGTICLGHQRSEVLLYPDPHLAFVNKVIGPDGAPLHMASVMSIVGFIQTAKLSSPPILSHHVIIPKLHPAQTSSLYSASLFEAEESNLALCAVMNMSLRDEKMAAVVQLRSGWFGLIHAFAEDCNGDISSTVLMLYILPPKLVVEKLIQWTTPTPTVAVRDKEEGSISPAGDEPYDDTESDPSTAQLHQQQALNNYKQLLLSHMNSPFCAPVPGSSRSVAAVPYKSYVSSKTNYVIPTISQEALQADWAKIVRYLQILPTKRDILYTECEKIRQAAATYYFPQLLAQLLDILGNELKSLKEYNDVALIISDLIQQLQEGEPIRVRPQHSSMSAGSPPSKMSLDRLLN